MTPQFHVAVADQGLAKNLEGQLSEAKAEIERLKAQELGDDRCLFIAQRDELKTQVERLRAHLEKRRDHANVFISVDGLQAVFKELDRLRLMHDRERDLRMAAEAQVHEQARQFKEFVERDAADVVELRRQRDELKTQVERLLTARRIRH
jgi:hypothetical protein